MSPIHAPPNGEMSHPTNQQICFVWWTWNIKILLKKYMITWFLGCFGECGRIEMTSVCLCLTAMWRGVSPFPFFAFTCFGFIFSSFFVILGESSLAAAWIGKSPRLSLIPVSALLLINNSAVFCFPFLIAWNSAVLLSKSFLFTSAVNQ